MDAFARDNTPQSSAPSSELTRDLTREFEQELGNRVWETTADTMTPVGFRGFLSELHKLLMSTGREVVERLVEEVGEPCAGAAT